VFLGLSLAAALLAADGAPTLPRRVPASTVLACYADRASAVCEAFQRTDLGAAWTGPDFVPLTDALKKADRPAPLHLRPMFGFDWVDLVQVGDESGLFVFRLDDGDMGMAWVFAGEADPKGALPACIDAADKYFAGRDFAKAKKDHGKATLITYKSPKGSDRAAFVAEGFYGVANSPAAAIAVLDVVDDSSLASAKEFKSSEPALGKAPEESDLRFYVRPLPLWQLVRRRDLPAGAGARDTLATAQRMGLADIQAIRGVIALDSGDTGQVQLEARMFAPRLEPVKKDEEKGDAAKEGADEKTFTYQKAMGMFDMVPLAKPHLPAWVPADALSVTTWGWDFPEAMKAFGYLFDEASDPGSGGSETWDWTLDGLKEKLPETPGIDVREDLFKRLGPEMIAVTLPEADAKGGDEEPPPSRSFVYSFAARESDQIVEKVFAPYYEGDKEVGHAEVNGHDVWNSPKDKSLFIAGDWKSLATIRSLAVGDGRVMFSNDPEAVQAAIAPGGDKASMVESALWKEFIAWLDREEGMSTAFRSLARFDATAGPGYELAHADGVLKADETVSSRLWRYVLFGTADRGADLPHKAVPAFAKWSDALAPSGLLLSKTDDGWIVKFSTLSAGGGAK
jgi:hypothetical protein